MLTMQVLSSGPFCRAHLLLDFLLAFPLPFSWFFLDLLLWFLDLFFLSFFFFDFLFKVLFLLVLTLLFLEFLALFLFPLSLFPFFFFFSFLTFSALFSFLLFLFCFLFLFSFFTLFPGDLAILLRILTSSDKLSSLATSAERNFVELDRF